MVRVNDVVKVRLRVRVRVRFTITIRVRVRIRVTVSVKVRVRARAEVKVKVKARATCKAKVEFKVVLGLDARFAPPPTLVAIPISLTAIIPKRPTTVQGPMSATRREFRPNPNIVTTLI